MTKNKQYDIFISYRRDDGRQYARLIERELKSRGYSVFLDYEEIKDGIFEEIIVKAIQSAKIFLIVLTPKFLVRCSDADDWVRREIILANENSCHFIPVVPDAIVKSFPKSQTDSLPEEIRRAVLMEQWSEISFGQTLESSFSQMIKNRVDKYIGSPNRKHKMWVIALLSFLLLSIASSFFALSIRASSRKELMNDTFMNIPLNWDNKASVQELRAVNEILTQMVQVEGGIACIGAPSHMPDVDIQLEMPQVYVPVKSFCIGKYEVSSSQWHAIMGGQCNKEDRCKPVTGISFEECEQFVCRLFNLTGLKFAIPTEAEWEYAAKGGRNNYSYLFSGGDDVDKVSWYKNNSGGKAHDCNGETSGLYCNSIDVFDMSGNVCEWCDWIDVDFRLYSDMNSGTVSKDIIYNDNIKPHRGGAFDCDPYQLTVYHRDFADMTQGCDNIGLRLIIKEIDYE